jgi:hypothetical protein
MRRLVRDIYAYGEAAFEFSAERSENATDSAVLISISFPGQYQHTSPLATRESSGNKLGPRRLDARSRFT